MSSCLQLMTIVAVLVSYVTAVYITCESGEVETCIDEDLNCYNCTKAEKIDLEDSPTALSSPDPSQFDSGHSEVNSDTFTGDGRTASSSTATASGTKSAHATSSSSSKSSSLGESSSTASANAHGSSYGSLSFESFSDGFPNFSYGFSEGESTVSSNGVPGTSPSSSTAVGNGGKSSSTAPNTGEGSSFTGPSLESFFNGFLNPGNQEGSDGFPYSENLPGPAGLQGFIRQQANSSTITPLYVAHECATISPVLNGAASMSQTARVQSEGSDDLCNAVFEFARQTSSVVCELYSEFRKPKDRGMVCLPSRKTQGSRASNSASGRRSSVLSSSSSSKGKRTYGVSCRE